MKNSIIETNWNRCDGDKVECYGLLGPYSPNLRKNRDPGLQSDILLHFGNYNSQYIIFSLNNYLLKFLNVERDLIIDLFDCLNVSNRSIVSA